MRIVDIDEESLKEIGQWPWPRTVLADLVDKLAANGAAAIGFDIVFPEPDRMSPANALRFWPKSDALASLREEVEKLPSNDQVFAEAIGKGPVVLGFISTPEGTSQPETKAGFAHGGDDPALFAPYYPGAAASLKELQDKAQGAGSLNWIPEHDQIIRRMPMIVRIGDKLYPSLAADLLRLAQGASTYVVKSSGASGEKAFGEKTGIVGVKVGDYEVPTEANGQMWIKFTPSSKQRYLPAYKVLNGEIGRDEIEGPHPHHRHERGGPARPASDSRWRRPSPASSCMPRRSSRSSKAPSCSVPTSQRRPSSSTFSCSASSSLFSSIGQERSAAPWWAASP